MKTKFFTIQSILFALISILILSESQPAHATLGDDLAKRRTKAVCTAIIASTTSFATYTTNIVHPDKSRPIFSMTNPLYRNRKVMHTFLARGLGKKFAEYFGHELKLEEEHSIAIHEPWAYEINVEEIESRWNEDVVRRGFIFSKDSTLEKSNGFIILPGLLARFTFTRISEEEVEYNIFDMYSPKVLQSGRFSFETLTSLKR